MKILLIEDDPRVSELIIRSLTEQGFSITHAIDGKEGRRLALHQVFDIIITDILLPQINGLELCRELKRLVSDTPILMLTALGTTDDKIEGFDAGADDYLVKPFEMRELVARIRALAKRSQKHNDSQSAILNYADLELNLFTKRVTRGGNDIQLTPKEFNLLAFMLKHPERVLSRAEIAENVWDTHFDTGTNFIDVYINYLRKKIDKPANQKLIHTKSGMGFILKTE
jgi:DNA-binding response OmpR family regulator